VLVELTFKYKLMSRRKDNSMIIGLREVRASYVCKQPTAQLEEDSETYRFCEMG
jgi:hypothetical protein